jgi:pimeloyl-ACP methyl ester carboxylesterase
MKKFVSACLYSLAAVFMLAAAAANPTTVQDKFFNSNGVQIRYVEGGKGEPIVLVHGYTSNIETGWMENGVFENLAKDYHVIAFDVRGHGKSGKPHDPKAYGTEMSEDIVRLLDHLNIRRAHIVGYSLGGGIVAKLVTMHPDRFLTLTLGGNAGRNIADEPSDRAVEIEAKETEQGSFGTLILRVAPTDRPPPSDAAIQKSSQQILDRGNDPIALAAHVRNRHSLAVTDAQMAAVRVPTLAVVGSLDPNLMKVNRLKMVMPSLKVVVIQGAAHAGATAPLGATRRPEFVNAVREFIAEHHNNASP